MKDYASKEWIAPRAQARSTPTQAYRRELTWRRALNGGLLIVAALVGALVGYNVKGAAAPRLAPGPVYYSLGQPTGPLVCLPYHGCESCEQHGRDGRVIYSTLRC